MHLPVLFAAIVILSSQAMAGLIYPNESMLEVLPGSQVRILWIVDDISTPLFGYSLDLNLVSSGIGSVSANQSESNFFESRNLIMAAGVELDPLFSVINSDGFGGIFVSTNTSDFSSVLPISGVNDVLAEIVFDVDESANGDFVFELAGGSVLSDANGFPVSFETISLTVRVIPSPSSMLLLAPIGLVAFRRRRLD